MGLAGRIHENVPRLQVPVDHSPLVGVLDRSADLAEEIHDLAGGRAAPPSPLVHVLPVDVLHHEEPALSGPPRVVEPHHVRMGQVADQLELPLDAHPRPLGVHPIGPQHLDGHPAPRGALHRLVDDALTAPMDLRDDVVALRRPGRLGRRIRRRPGHGQARTERTESGGEPGLRPQAHDERAARGAVGQVSIQPVPIVGWSFSGDMPVQTLERGTLGFHCRSSRPADEAPPPSSSSRNAWMRSSTRNLAM